MVFLPKRSSRIQKATNRACYKKHDDEGAAAQERARGPDRLAMGRGRRAGPSSGDDSDDGASPAGGLSSQLAKGSKKQWKPGMSGKEQKARAKEQRLEQERRKAERERRNEDKREKREQLEHESAEISGATPPPRSASRRARQHDDGGPSSSFSRDGGGPAHHHHHGSPHRHNHHHARGFVHDATTIRRELRRLFGRIQHGGNVVSLDSGVAVACEVEDVFVVVVQDAASMRRKSGAEAWSARVQKGAETEQSLAAFLLAGTNRDDAKGGHASDVRRPDERADYERAPEEGREPPYHRVCRVFARRVGGDDEPRVVLETLWDAHVSADDASGARKMGSLRLEGQGYGSPDAYGSPSTSRRDGSFRGGSSFGSSFKRRAVAASSLLPGHCWEEVFARCDPASVARLGATCVELAQLARSSLVRQAQHAKLFGRAAPVGSPPRSPRPPRAGAPPAPPASPAALEAAAARKGWAATCASFVAADPWLPRLPALSAARGRGDGDAGSEDEDEDEAFDERDGARFSDGSASEGVAFDDDDDDFGTGDATRTFSDDRESPRPSTRVSKERRERERSVSSTSAVLKPPRPRAAFRGVGPQSARHMLANDAAAVSCDGAKIKLWFHGGDGVTESGKRIATLPNPAGAASPWTALAAGPGTFLAGDAAGRLTVWDADTLEVKHARCHGVAEWDEETQNPVNRANAPLSSLVAIPNSTLVACASTDTSVVRFLDVAPPAEAPQAGAAVHSHVRVIGLGPGSLRPGPDDAWGADADDADIGFMGVDALAVSGGEVTYGAGADNRAFAPRGPGSSAPKLWAVTRSATLGDARLVSVDLGTLAVGSRLKIPDAFFPELERVSTRAYGEPSANAVLGSRSRFSVAAYGDLVAAARDGVAAVWDARVASAARETPVMLFRDDAERSLDFSLETAPPGGVAVDEWAVWVCRGNSDGVRLYDARRATGPPRGKSRWHDGDALLGSPVAVYGVRGENDKGDEDRFVRVGAFARGGDGALVVAPAAPIGSLLGEVSAEDRGLRCSVFTSARHGDGTAEDGEAFDAESAAWEDGFAKPKAGKKKAAKKVRKKYPKRQGGKFRARTAGG